MTERPIRITKRMVDDTIAQFEGTLERAPLDTRVATVRDLFERVDVDRRELKAVAVRNVTTDQAVTGRMQYTSGSGGRTRTYDQAVNSRPLYQLSYAGAKGRAERDRARGGRTRSRPKDSTGS
jgi:hypothetical protein